MRTIDGLRDSRQTPLMSNMHGFLVAHDRCENHRNHKVEKFEIMEAWNSSGKVTWLRIQDNTGGKYDSGGIFKNRWIERGRVPKHVNLLFRTF